MIILGDKIVPFENISFISNIDEIKQTKANSTLIFFYDEELLVYCFNNQLSFAVITSSLNEAIYSNSLSCKYIICKKDLAKEIQKVAENYMYDAKILAIIESNNEFEEIIKSAEIVDFEHTKTGKQLKVLKVKDRIANFKAFNEYLINNGIAYYSRFAQGFIIKNLERVQVASSTALAIYSQDLLETFAKGTLF